MRFQVLDILPNLKNPVTGREIRPDERFAQALASARHAEECGYDAVALGERHAGAFLSSGVSVLLGGIAATTSRIRLQTGVSVLSINDPLRVAEDYATIDQLSRGRLELVIGKGNELQSFSLPTMIPHEQQLDMLERLAGEVIPIVRKAAPTTRWGEEDPYGGRPAAAGRTTADAAAEIEKTKS
jgi:alkanesulfonate monooxygenase SsuD/methylene tetrahydromethanopterin reductase-like flavin-dependent oxidoreductase (luciferase family)